MSAPPPAKHPSSAAARRKRSISREKPAPPQPFICLAGPYQLEISAGESPERRELSITIQNSSGKPLPGEPVAVEVPGHDRETLSTDDHGRFRCPLPARCFRLRIGERGDDPGWSLEIEIDD